jgi:hypothetical protein
VCGYKLTRNSFEKRKLWDLERWHSNNIEFRVTHNAKANPKLQLFVWYLCNITGMQEFCANQMDLPYMESRLIELDSN